jgi:hypothetical protein
MAGTLRDLASMHEHGLQRRTQQQARGAEVLACALHCRAQETWVQTLESMTTRAVSSLAKLIPVQPPTPLKASAINRRSPPLCRWASCHNGCALIGTCM